MTMTTPFGPRDIERGDQVKVNNAWLPVIRVNPKTLTVRNPKGWDDRYAYALIQGHRPKHVRLPENAPTTLPPRTEVLFGFYEDGNGLVAELVRHGPDA